MDSIKPLTLDEEHIRLKNILEYLNDVCKKNNITFYLEGGTLLGAIRHKGFIPWDDDVDVILFRDDYEKLISVMKSDNSQYKLLSLETPNYPFPYAKLVDSDTTLQERGAKPVKDMGLFVDVFPIDKLPNDPKEQEKFFKRSSLLRKISRASLQNKSFKSFAKKIGVAILKHLNARKAAIKFDQHAQLYRTADAKYYANMVGASDTKTFLDIDWFNPPIYVDFEDLQLPAPQNYDAYLTEMYGDYMQLPPEDQRTTHHIEAYKRK